MIVVGVILVIPRESKVQLQPSWHDKSHVLTFPSMLVSPSLKSALPQLLIPKLRQVPKSASEYLRWHEVFF